MENIIQACEALEKSGQVKKVSDKVYLIGSIDSAKLADLQKSYAEAFRERWLQRRANEQKAEKEYQDFVITY